MAETSGAPSPSIDGRAVGRVEEVEPDEAGGDGARSHSDTEKPEDAGYSIDELASISGVPSRTIRYYQSKGLVPAPERHGRVAVYRTEHLERLVTIAELQDRGLRLDAIRDALRQLANGDDSLQDWLGMGDLLQQPWSDDRPTVMSETELIDRLGLTRPGVLADLERLGFVERQTNARPATYVVRSPALLDIGAELTTHGIDPVTIAESEALLRKRISRLCDEMVEFFAGRAGEGFGGGGEPDEILDSYAALRPVGLRAIQLIFAQEMERALRRFVEAGGAIPKERSRGGSRTRAKGAAPAGSAGPAARDRAVSRSRRRRRH